jgi:hypothetical protein
MLGSCSFQTEVPGSAHGQNFLSQRLGLALKLCRGVWKSIGWLGMGGFVKAGTPN